MIARYISELLLNHDCVIIPGFGGLIVRFSGSSYDSEHKTLLPPSRKLLFNNQLVINDGLLLNYISRREKITYADASLRLMKWTQEIKNSVNAGNRAVMEGIGSFYLNHEKSLQFAPDNRINFMLSSYGLKPVTVTAPARTKPKVITLNRKTDNPNTDKVKEYVSIAAALALLIASVLMFPTFEMNLASLAGFWNKQDYVQPAEPVNQIQFEGENHEEKITSPNATAAVEEPEQVIPENAPEQIHIPAEESNTAETSVASTTAAKGEFHIIAGCFKIEENANKLVELLTAQGLKAAIIGKSKTGLTMVSAGGFVSASEANERLNDMKTLLPDGGWVFHHSAKE